MKLISLDPIGPFNREWERTFGDNEKSTVNLRHTFVHKGIDWRKVVDLEFDMNFIKERIKDAIVLVCYLEQQISEKYRHIKELYPERG